MRFLRFRCGNVPLPQLASAVLRRRFFRALGGAGNCSAFAKHRTRRTEAFLCALGGAGDCSAPAKRRTRRSEAFLCALGGAGDCFAPAKLRTRFTAGRFSVWDGVSSRTRKEPRRKIPPRLLASADRTPACANSCAGGRLFDKVAIQKDGCVSCHFACRPPLPHTPAKIAHPFTFFVSRTFSFLSERRFLAPQSNACSPVHPFPCHQPSAQIRFHPRPLKSYALLRFCAQ